MKALSIKQPWAWLICAGQKDIENRKWATTRRERIQIHAGKSEDSQALEWLLQHGFPATPVLLLFGDSIPKGAIIGEVDIVDCVTESDSLWFNGPYGFVLANPVLYDKPIPCKGRLGFFEPVL